MFAKERYSESKLHVERSDGLPTLCLECAKSEFHNDVSGQFVGILTAVESMKYAQACALDAPANKFRDDGLAVVKSDQSAIMAIDLMQSFIKGEPIAHLANSMQLNALKAHDGRKWKNIYPCKKPFDSKQNTRIALIVKPFTTFLETRFFPHDFYARMARQMVAVLESDKNDLLKLNRQQGDTLLCLKTINGLVRGASLNERQNLHIDGYEVGLTALYIEKCGDDGYKFYHIPKSHNRLESHDPKIPIPISTIQCQVVQKGEIIVFADSLIHGGGESSSPSSSGHYLGAVYDNWCARGEIDPTDIAFHVTYVHSSCPTGIDLGQAKNVWYSHDRENIDKATFQEYVDSKDGCFGKRLDVASKRWLNKVCGIKERVSGRRQKHGI
jgi:hypothetical protein